MKRYIILLWVMAAALFLPGCEKDNAEKSAITGEWKLTGWSIETSETFEVYINFMDNGTFLIYQNVETALFVTYSGTYSTANGYVTGVYSDGVPWGAAYKYSLSDDGNQLTMTTDTELSETSIYTRTVIPDSVKQGQNATSRADAAIPVRRML